MPSTAELTSDDGHSVPSTAGSPPLPPTQVHNDLPVVDKPLEQKVKIVGQDHVAVPAEKQQTTQEETVEANLGRKRCIKFACKGKEDDKPTPPTSESAKAESTSPPKRKCMLKFICPSRADAGGKATEKTKTKRPVSPPPPERKSSSNAKHRGSDSTLTHLSSKQVRKTPVVENDAEDTPQTEKPSRERGYSNDSNEDSGDEGTRFHEFATSEGEPEDWTQMSTCYRTRLTVDDTLKKEHVIRKTCEEVEEEALEEEEEEEEKELDEELAAVAGGDELADEADEEYDTDEGFHSDDEDGFANSDSEDDGDSDFEWWKPGGLSTAATSVDQLDRLAWVNSQQTIPGTSDGSTNSSQTSPYASKANLRKVPSKRGQTPAMTINRPASPDLPDSTDFVCGTLDEDRPLEQAFVNRRAQKQAAKRGFCPQDIDPSFPTSDPEMDEEDDDVVNAEPHAEEEDDMMHGDLDEIDGDGTARRKSPVKIKTTARSPPPPAATRYHSPPPPNQRPTCHSPPPPTRRSIARSPAPYRKLFGRSPGRVKSPAPIKPMTSPPNSPAEGCAQHSIAPQGLAGRPQLVHTSSLPRGGGITISTLATIPSDDESSDGGANTEIPKRGAVDIVKGLEKKRQWRKRRLAQKMNAKAANKPEKSHKVKPGTGCERMREVGLALQEYHGKAEHILSL